MRRFLKVLLLLLLSLSFVVFISFVFAIWRGYPRGGDAMVHSLKVFWVLKFFPHHNWWNVWVAGMPHFQFYPVGPNLVMAFVSKIFNFSPEAVMTGALVISMGLTGFFIGLLVDEYSGSFLAGVLTSFVFISTPVMWLTAVFYGSYIRPIAMPFMIASVYFALKLVHKPENKKYLFMLVIFLALSVYTHLLMGNRAVGLAILVFIFFVPGFKKKLLITVKTILLYALVSASFLIPLFAFSPEWSFNVGDTQFTLDRYRFFEIQEVLGISQGSVFKPNSFLNSSPFSISLFILLLLVALILNRKVFKEKIFWFFGLGTVGFLVFPVVKLHFLTPLYLVAGGINSLLHLSLIFGTISVGLLIGKIFSKKDANYVGFILIVMLFAWVWANFSPDPATWKELIFLKSPVRSNEKDFLSLEVPDDAQYRFGTGTEAHLAMIFNRYHPDYPQTRDYFGNGILNIDFDFYLVKAVWDWDGNLDETKFLLDWWAVDKFVVRLTSENLAKYDVFDLVGKLTALRIYEAPQSRPILSSGNTLTVLVVGGKPKYDVFFRSLAQANINSSQIIPIWSGTDHLNISLSELKKFGAVFIYDLPPNNKNDFKALKEYVEQGGFLFIEGPKGEAFDLPEVFPVRNIKRHEVVGDWELSFQEYDFGTNFDNFSPPVFEEGPWGVSLAEAVSSWAQVLVNESGEPIIVGGRFGKGKVVWSGMNLMYHAGNYKNKEEALFIKDIFDWLQGNREITRADFEVEFVHPEKRIVKLGSSAKGVLFKEVHFPKWRAYLEKGGKKTKLSIYTAGPDFMYIPLSDAGKGDNIILEYKNTLIDFLGALISSFTLFFLILWLFDWWIFKPWIVASAKKITSPIKAIADWWRREDDV